MDTLKPADLTVATEYWVNSRRMRYRGLFHGTLHRFTDGHGDKWLEFWEGQGDDWRPEPGDPYDEPIEITPVQVRTGVV